MRSFFLLHEIVIRNLDLTTDDLGTEGFELFFVTLCNKLRIVFIHRVIHSLRLDPVADQPGFELSLLEHANRIEDRLIHPLHHGGQDVSGLDPVLIGVHTDGEFILLGRRIENPEARIPGRNKDHLDAAIVLIKRKLLCFRRIVPGIPRHAEVVCRDLGFGIDLFHARRKSHFKPANERHIHSSDESDLSGLCVKSSKGTDQVAPLMLLEHHGSDIGRLRVLVDQQELLVWKPCRIVLHRLELMEADCDDEIELLFCERTLQGLIGRIVRCLHCFCCQPQFLLRALESLIRRSIEGLVVLAGAFKHQANPEIRSLRSGEQVRSRSCNDHPRRHPDSPTSRVFHIHGLYPILPPFVELILAAPKATLRAMAGRKLIQGSTIGNERGQSIVLVAIMILSFLMFFTFALNTGLLIHAKISVQSAADAAAYAGAATQGRQLNAISFLNYDMRRQYKKFLFRNAFVGALGSPNFPKTSTGQTSGPYDFPKWDFTNTPASRVPLRVPVICIPLIAKGVNSDRCMQLNMRNTSFDIRDKLGVLPGGGSSIIQALVQSTQNLNNAMEKTCVGQSGINEAVLISWLFKGENKDSYIETLVDNWFQTAGAATNQNKGSIKELMKGLVKGLGLYPRNILHLMRIETMAKFINHPPQSAVDLETVEASEQDSSKAEKMERTILAFKSALSNLNQDIFDPSLVQMDELQPSEMLKLEPLYAGSGGGTGGTQNDGLNVFYQASQIQGTSTANDTEMTFCKSYAQQITLKGIPVGVKRIQSGSKNVVYAVKVRAYIKPRGLLFAPWSENLELTAIAGAKPFGSRVGPAAIQSSSFGFEVDMNGVRINGPPVCDMGLSPQCPVPNIEVGAGKTFFDTEFLTQMKSFAMESGVYSLAGIQKAQYHAMAPNPKEVGRYGIIPPPPANSPGNMRYEFLPYFDGKGIPQNTQFNPNLPIYRFYAPIHEKSVTDPENYIATFLAFLKNNPATTQYGYNPETTYNTALDSIKRYINDSLINGDQPENTESLTFAAIELPMYNLNSPDTQSFWLTKGSEVLTSWGPRHIKTASGPYYSPRFGYSVKHVALRELMSEGVNSMDDEIDSIPH